MLLGKLVHNDVLKKLVLVGGWNDVVDVSITVVVVVVDQEKVQGYQFEYNSTKVSIRQEIVKEKRT